MPITSCDPCCNPHNHIGHKDSFRTAILTALCGIIDAVQELAGTAPISAVTETMTEVDNVSDIILPANVNRVGAYIVNPTDETVWISFTATAVAGACNEVLPGGSLDIAVPRGGRVFKGDVTAIKPDGSAANVLVVEAV